MNHLTGNHHAEIATEAMAKLASISNLPIGEMIAAAHVHALLALAIETRRASDHRSMDWEIGH